MDGTGKSSIIFKKFIIKLSMTLVMTGNIYIYGVQHFLSPHRWIQLWCSYRWI